MIWFDSGTYNLYEGEYETELGKLNKLNSVKFHHLKWMIMCMFFISQAFNKV